jgi:hypothetical protein
MAAVRQFLVQKGAKMQTLAQFLEDNEPPKEGGVLYYSVDLRGDHVLYIPWVPDKNRLHGGFYDEARTTIVRYPEGERLVRLPLPPWMMVVVEGDVNIYARDMFTSEAAAAARAFSEELQKFLPS